MSSDTCPVMSGMDHLVQKTIGSERFGGQVRRLTAHQFDQQTRRRRCSGDAQAFMPGRIPDAGSRAPDQRQMIGGRRTESGPAAQGLESTDVGQVTRCGGDDAVEQMRLAVRIGGAELAR